MLTTTTIVIITVSVIVILILTVLFFGRPPTCKAGKGNPRWFSKCDKCEAGTFSGPGAVECEKCKEGTSSGPGSSQCVECKVGTFSGLGAVKCDECKAGTFSGLGAVKCDECQEGTFSGPGAEECYNCKAGTYSSGSGICDDCKPGTFSGPGFKKCDECEVGTFSGPGAEECKECEVGTYSSTIGSAQCTPCPINTYSDSKKTIRCAPCESSATTGTTKCYADERNQIAKITEVAVDIIKKSGIENEESVWNAIYIYLVKEDDASLKAYQGKTYLKSNLEMYTDSEIEILDSTRFSEYFDDFILWFSDTQESREEEYEAMGIDTDADPSASLRDLYATYFIGYYVNAICTRLIDFSEIISAMEETFWYKTMKDCPPYQSHTCYELIKLLVKIFFNHKNIVSAYCTTDVDTKIPETTYNYEIFPNTYNTGLCNYNWAKWKEISGRGADKDCLVPLFELMNESEYTLNIKPKGP
jgi:hypothetical protein